jgi:hypothetical protein
MPENVSQIPASRVPITLTEIPSREWYRYFYNVFSLLGSGSLRYGAFHSTAPQPLASAGVAQAVTYNVTDISKGVYIGTPTSRLYVDRPGAYDFQFSLQLVSLDLLNKFAYVWARVNGNDISYSATKITMLGNNDAYVASGNFVLRMNTGDYFELMWSGNNLNLELAAEVAAPPHPGIPSVIMTVSCNIGE